MLQCRTTGLREVRALVAALQVFIYTVYSIHYPAVHIYCILKYCKLPYECSHTPYIGSLLKREGVITEVWATKDDQKHCFSCVLSTAAPSPLYIAKTLYWDKKNIVQLSFAFKFCYF